MAARAATFMRAIFRREVVGQSKASCSVQEVLRYTNPEMSECGTVPLNIKVPAMEPRYRTPKPRVGATKIKEETPKVFMTVQIKDYY
jgi:hypothetical protein